MKTKVNLSKLYDQWKENPCQHTEDVFATALINYVERVSRRLYKRELQLSDDASGAALIYIWKYLNTYNPAKAKFTTWVSTVVENLYKRKIQEVREEFEERLGNDLVTDGGIMNLENKILLNQLIAKLEPEDQELVRLHFEGFTDAEVGEKLGKNWDWVHDKWRRVIMPALQKAAGTGG